MKGHRVKSLAGVRAARRADEAPAILIERALAADRVRAVADAVLSAERVARIVGQRFEPRPALSDVIQTWERNNPDLPPVDRDGVEQDLNERGSFAAALCCHPRADGLTFAWYGGGDILVIDQHGDERDRLRDLLPRVNVSERCVASLIADLVHREASL